MKKQLIVLLSISSILISVHALELNYRIAQTDNEMNFITRNIDNNITPRDRNPYINMLRGVNSKGHQIFQKYLQEPCQMSAQTFASKHTQDEWEEIAESGIFQEYIIKLCPAIKDIYQTEWSEELYQFVYEHAYDSESQLVS